MVEQKTAIALFLIIGCTLLLYGCTGASNGMPSQGGQVSAPTPSQNGAPTDSGASYQPTTGIASLSENDTNVATGDNDGTGYTELPVDDGTDSPLNGS